MDKDDFVNVELDLPIEAFEALWRECERTGKTSGQILGELMEELPLAPNENEADDGDSLAPSVHPLAGQVIAELIMKRLAKRG